MVKALVSRVVPGSIRSGVFFHMNVWCSIPVRKSVGSNPADSIFYSSFALYKTCKTCHTRLNEQNVILFVTKKIRIQCSSTWVDMIFYAILVFML